MLEIFVRWLVPFLCGGAVSMLGAAVSMMRRVKRRQEAIELGLQSLLRAEIIRQYEKYQDRQHCPIYAKEALTRAYDSYHALGGNDIATGLYHKTMSLPEENPDDGAAGKEV